MDPKLSTPRSGGILRDVMVISLISVAAIALFEGFVRIAMNERPTTVYENDVQLGRPDPVLGYVNNPGAVAHVTGPEYSVEYRISEQGFRDPVVYLEDPKPGTVRVLLVGDSYTFGHGVSYLESWATLIRDRFEKAEQPVEIINAGVQGYSTTQQVLSLETLLPRFKPDVVVLGFVAHDLVTNRPIDETGAVAKIAEGATISVGSDKKSNLHSIALLKRMLVQSDYIYTRAYAYTARRRWYEKPPSDWLAKQYKITEELLTRAARVTDEADAELVVLSMPQAFQVFVEARDDEFDRIHVGNIDETFSALAKDEGFMWVSSLRRLAQHYAEVDEDLYFRMDGHFNAAGNAVFAEIVFDPLSQVVLAKVR